MSLAYGNVILIELPFEELSEAEKKELIDCLSFNAKESGIDEFQIWTGGKQIGWISKGSTVPDYWGSLDGFRFIL